MDALNELLINYGYIGILIASFLAASILPFSSEVVMVGLLAAGLDPAKCTLFVQSQVPASGQCRRDAAGRDAGQAAQICGTGLRCRFLYTLNTR